MEETQGGGPGAQAMPRMKSDSALPEIADVTVGELLGEGGQGVVYRGFQEFLARDVAIKVLHRSVDRDLARFRQEATLLASLHHPNIVACYQAGVGADEECYMVLEFVDGPDLCGYVRDKGALDELTALSLALDVARGLEHGYEQGSRMIHRDIKPQNILIQSCGGTEGPRLRGKVVDLGLARCLEESMELTRDGAVMGTPVTMAPEQFDCPREADHRTDMYGLGCVLYYALTGDAAFKGKTITAIYKQKVDEKTSRPHRDLAVSAGTKGLLDKLLAPSQADRPGTYGVLIDDIQSAMRALQSGAPVRRPRWAGAAALVGVLAAGGVVVMGAAAGTAKGEEPNPVGVADGRDSEAGSMVGGAPVTAEPVGAVKEAAALSHRSLPALMGALGAGEFLDLIGAQPSSLQWCEGPEGAGGTELARGRWGRGVEDGMPSLEGQPCMTFEGDQPPRTASEFLDDLRGRGVVAPEYQVGASELCHGVPAGDWAFEGDIALRRRSFGGELCGGVCFHRGDGSFLEVSAGVVLPPEQGEDGAEEGQGRRRRAVVRCAWFAANGTCMGESYCDTRDFPGATTEARSTHFMANGAGVVGMREEVVVSIQLRCPGGERAILCLGDYLILELETPIDLPQNPIRQVAAFVRMGDLALRRWRISPE